MDLRRVLDGVFYVNKTGCQGRMMPTNIGNAHTIYGYFRRWRREGGWARVMETLRQWERQSQGRLPEPSACCADSQSIKTATQHEDVGFDGNKKIKGRKRHIMIETLGLIVAVVVTAAHTDDRLGLVLLVELFHGPLPAAESGGRGTTGPHTVARHRPPYCCVDRDEIFLERDRADGLRRVCAD